MKQLKSLVSVIGLMLMILSVIAGALSISYLSDMLSAGEYEDKGVYTFLPYEVLPVQVKNTGAVGRQRRMNPTRTVYKIYYRDQESGSYRWTDEAYSRESGEKVVDAGYAVRRRVLSIPEEGTYVTVERDLNAESYTAGLRGRYIRVIGLSGAYVFFYMILLGVWYYRRS